MIPVFFILIYNHWSKWRCCLKRSIIVFGTHSASKKLFFYLWFVCDVRSSTCFHFYEIVSCRSLNSILPFRIRMSWVSVWVRRNMKKSKLTKSLHKQSVLHLNGEVGGEIDYFSHTDSLHKLMFQTSSDNIAKQCFLLQLEDPLQDPTYCF